MSVSCMCLMYQRVPLGLPPGHAKDAGPSYPQAIAVVAKGLEGLYVVATNNKEDVVVARVKVPFADL